MYSTYVNCYIKIITETNSAIRNKKAQVSARQKKPLESYGKSTQGA